jgi:hypothetical protein
MRHDCARLTSRAWASGDYRLRGVLRRLVLGNRLLQILEAELQLLVGQVFGAATELVAAQTLDQQA